MLKLTNAKTALAEKKLPEEKTNTDVEEKKNTEKVVSTKASVIVISVLNTSPSVTG